ncbi:MAG: molybdopterin-dependent oxidoreductase [Treponema sp.]|jgi:CO/xanthine dehydrogenase Mo-binding subunit|nr:molybdopterin-dependent oxidoreductase [Treponema sp.]
MNTPHFVDDITIQGTYFAVIIRSPIAHGRLKAVQCPDMPNSCTLITAADIPGVNQLADFPVPVLADDTLSYIGEPVGILTGFDMRKLEDYSAQCKVVCEELSPVFSSGEIPPSHILAERRVSLDCAAEREEAAQTISGVYKTGIQEHWYADPHGAVAIPAQDQLVCDNHPEEKNLLNKMLIHTATLWPFHVKRSVCQILGIPAAAIVVEPSLIGLHLDGKIWYPSLVACHAALAAHLIRRPVKLVLTREEDFRYSPKRNASVISITSNIGVKQKTLETNVTVRADMGAQGVFTDEILDYTCLGSMGAYSWPRLALEGRAFSTNLPPQGPLSGFGLAQGFFAIERHVSRIADSLHQDPAEWRKNHALQGQLGIGAPHNAGIASPIAELIDSAAAMCDYYRKWASYELLRQKRHGEAWQVRDESPRGIGIAVAYQGNGFLHQWNKDAAYAIELTLNKNSLEICTGLVFSNTSRASCVERWQSIAAEILSINEKHISVSVGNTDTAPDSGPASCSQSVVTITGLVEEACNELQERRTNPAESLPLHTRRVYQPVLRSAWGEDSGKQFDERALSNLSWAAAVVEVSIDQVSYLPKIRGVWLGVEAGRIFSAEQACLSLKTTTIHALGWAAHEELSYKLGKIPDSYMFGYDIPSIAELPPIYIDFMKRDDSHGKGIGELPFNCVPAAYVQAVSQAMDHPFEKIPLTPLDLWNVEKARLP